PPEEIKAGGASIRILEPSPRPVDRDGDGRIDFLLVGGYGGEIWLFENKAPKGKPPELTAGIVLNDPKGPAKGSGGRFNILQTADLNGDGVIDLVNLGEGSRDTIWFWP